MLKKYCLPVALALALVFAGSAFAEEPGARVNIKLPNTRDLGGYVTSDGKSIKPHKLLRSGNLSKLSAEDAAVLTGTYGLKKVVDLRTESEQLQKPDFVIEGVEYISLPLATDEAAGVEKNPSTTTDPKASLAAFLKRVGGDPSGFMMKLYTEMATYGETHKNWGVYFDTLLATPEGAVLYHCNSGKDRVGITTVLTLYALGVPMETIRKDYLQSNVYQKPEIDGVAAALAPVVEDAKLRQAIAATSGVTEEWLDGFLNLVEKEYGSLDAFLEKEVGLTAEKKAQLRAMYLQ